MLDELKIVAYLNQSCSLKIVAFTRVVKWIEFERRYIYHIQCIFTKTKSKCKKQSPRSATITSQRYSLTQGSKRKRHKPTCAKQINTRKAHRPALSCQSEVISMLNGLKNTRTQHKERLNINRLIEWITKPHMVRATPDPRLETVSSINYQIV